MKTSISAWRPGWLSIAVCLTLAYAFVLFLVLLPATELCDDRSGVLNSILSCRDSNELGDLLSGAFAPVAFLWLVAAVFIQAQELKAQRDELALTRQELAASREVMKEQAEQAREQAIQSQRQADYIGEQTENLRRQAEDHFRQLEDRTFDETLKALHKGPISKLSRFTYKIDTPNGQIHGGLGDYQSMEAEKAVIKISEELGGLYESLKKASPNATIKLRPATFLSLAEGIDKLMPIESKLSLSYQIKFNTLGLSQTFEIAKAISLHLAAAASEGDSAAG